MRLNEINFDHAAPVEGYGPGFFRVGGKVHQGGLILLPSEQFPWGGYEDMDTLVSRAERLDVLFVGTGAEIAHVPAEMRNRLEELGVGLEVMATPTACRSFNVLLSEGRRIGAALLPV